MDIKKYINQNGKLILQIALVIVSIFLGIKSLNTYYEKDEATKKEQIENQNKNQTTEKFENTEKNNNTIEPKSISNAIKSFVNYCNNRELESAYKMLTDDCKQAMFPTIEEFEKNYINNIFYITRTYEVKKWSTDGNISTYLITLYGDILSTGNTNNYTQDYYTFIKNDDGIYKLNINSYICKKDKNIATTVNNVTVKVEKVNVYEEYEEATITITNNTGKTICLTGNKYVENIYLQNSKGVEYSSLNSEFDEQELLVKANHTQTFIVEFNKVYNPSNKATYLVLSDIIFDYENYLNTENKTDYSNRTSIKIKY